MPTRVSHFTNLFKSATPFILYTNICGWLGAPNYFMPDVPPDSLIIIGLVLVLASCNATHFVHLFEESKQSVVATSSIVFKLVSLGGGGLFFFDLFSIRYKPYYASLLYSNGNLRLSYHLLEENVIFASVSHHEATFNRIRLLFFLFCFGKCAV